ncbi:AMP-binding protein [Haloechinothrix salitolerans]|uniref:AMP-binding protein n=1 Tax=Haloechinothrix salitolerans TaxID=926830 RepID=A0ABW2BUU2_9PSEU
MHQGIRAAPDPVKPAVIAAESAVSLSYGELTENSARLAGALHARGLERGDVVAILADLSPCGFETYWAALSSGLTFTPIDCSLSLEETAYVINDSGARALVVSAELDDLATELRPLTPGVDVRLAFGGVVDEHETYESVVLGSHTATVGESRGREMFYTAGVTGRPRATRVVAADGEPDEHTRCLRTLLTRSCAVDRDTVLLSALPFSDALGSQVAVSVHDAGGTVVTAARHSPEALLAAIEHYRVSVLHVAPAMLVRLVKLPQRVRDGYDLASVRAVIHSGAPCPAEAKQRAIDWLGPIVHEFYSGAERNVMSFIDATEWRARRGSVGRSVLGSVHVCDQNGDEVPRREVGTVYVERRAPAFWYHNAPDVTMAAQHPVRPNWTTVGDLGYVDDDGFLYLADRESFVITVDGGAVYPREVEDLLVMHPRVADAAVIGIPDERDGQQVKAVVQPERDAEPGPELARELIELARAHGGRHTVPRSVDFIDTVPRTAGGKLTKRSLMRKYALVDSVAP